MWKNICIFVALFGLLAGGVFASVSSGDFSSPEHPGKCVITKEIIVGPGLHRHPDYCARIDCSAGGFAEIADCGVQMAGPGCKLGNALNPDANYPDCCRQEVICV